MSLMSELKKLARSFTDTLGLTTPELIDRDAIREQAARRVKCPEVMDEKERAAFKKQASNTPYFDKIRKINKRK